MTKKQYTTLRGDIEAVHMASIRFFGEWGESHVIPLSLIENGDELDEDEDVEINVETWFCEKEGLG